MVLIALGVTVWNTKNIFEDLGPLRDVIGKQVSNLLFSRLNHNSSAAPFLMTDNPHRVSAFDVICDPTEERAYIQAGNKRFGIVVCMFLCKDYDMKNVSVRVQVCRAILATIKGDQRQQARFLARTSLGRWAVIDDVLAIKWISLVLKRAALALENQSDPKTIADCVKRVMRTRQGDEHADEELSQTEERSVERIIN